MPSNLLTIDDGFPSFTGEESPTEQIRALHNYLFQLREGLQYSLQNLSAENFNATALEDLTAGQKNAVVKELTTLQALVSSLQASTRNLTARVVAVEKLSGRVGTLETAVTAEGGLNDRVAAIEKTVTAEGGLVDRVTTAEEKLADIGGILAEQEDGSAVVGAEGKKLNLVGEVYINGVLFTQTQGGGDT